MWNFEVLNLKWYTRFKHGGAERGSIKHRSDPREQRCWYKEIWLKNEMSSYTTFQMTLVWAKMWKTAIIIGHNLLLSF